MNDKEDRYDLILPLLALCLSLLPILLSHISPYFRTAIPFFILLNIALPILGFILGIQCLFLSRGKRSIAGKLIAASAVVYPSASAILSVLRFLDAAASSLSNM